MWLITKFTESAQDDSTTINRARKKSQFTDQIVAGHVHSPPQSSFPKGKGTGPKPHPICLSHFTGVIGFTRSRPSPRRIQTPLSCSQVGTSGKSIEVWLLLFFSQPCLIIKGYCTVYTQYICVYIQYYILYFVCVMFGIIILNFVIQCQFSLSSAIQCIVMSCYVQYVMYCKVDVSCRCIQIYVI